MFTSSLKAFGSNAPYVPQFVPLYFKCVKVCESTLYGAEKVYDKIMILLNIFNIFSIFERTKSVSPMLLKSIYNIFQGFSNFAL